MNHPRKKPWELLLKRSRSDPHDLQQQEALSRVPPSSLVEPPIRPRRLSRELWRRITKSRHARSTGESANMPASNGADLLAVQPSQDLPNVNSGQAITSDTAKVDLPNERPGDVIGGVATMSLGSSVVQSTSSASNNIKYNLDDDTADTLAAILGPLKAFNSAVDEIADLHPYAKATLGILTSASEIILIQPDLDGAISHLLSNVSTVYVLVTQRVSLANISSMLETYTTIAQHTLKCAEFIASYSKKNGKFWKRLNKHSNKGANQAEIDGYNDVLDGLIERFRDQSTTHNLADGSELCGMEYVAGAGLNTSRCCLRDTRVDLLAEIKSWARSTGEDVPRILWLSGTAGKGKSAIAHTIANWSNELGGLGACFSFDRTRKADHCHEKIFTTIARDLADRNSAIRQALASVLHDDEELGNDPTPMHQWQKYIVQPIGMATLTAPVLIVIDALDESGEAHSREQILRVFAGKQKTSTSRPTKLPANFRILITSRPLGDIRDHLDAAPHVRHLSIDDIPAVSTEHDIQLYISTRLADPCNVFDDAHFKALAQKSDGLFEWARLACEYIKGMPKDPMNRFTTVVAGTSGSGIPLLDDMYRHILREIITEDEDAIAMFCSVMGQILVSLEPLSMTTLTAMRLHFPREDSHHEVECVIKPMGSLVTGIVDPQTPIRPLHASFYDFLTDRSRSGKFFADVSFSKCEVAFASLQVMKRGLRFNICSLESSYLPNSAVPDLETRVKECIPVELSYSCRLWGKHVRATSFEPSLAKEVEAFFDGEHLLFWLEALALMKHLGSSVDSLSSIGDWLTGHAEYTDLSDAVSDSQHFVRTFGTAILHSTPHLYLSALPFTPTQSRIFRTFATKFPSIPQVAAGHVLKWPLRDKVLDPHAEVQSVAFSPDGKKIACGTGDGMIQLWDMETSGTLGTLRGHTASVRSVAFSPDGRRIVSGSWDKTIWVWDVETREALGSPIRGHTDYIECVAIAPDGRRIVSCSWDKTIMMWDIETGIAFGNPLRGHTGYVWTVAISPDGKRIVSGSDDKTIRVWDMETGKALYLPLQGHLVGIRSVAISPDGKRIISGGSGSDDTTLRIWDVETGKALGGPFHGHFGDIWTVAISPDGKWVVSGSIDKTIRVWDMVTGETLGEPLRGHLGRIRSVAISPNGQFIISGSDDKTIRVWDANTGKAHIGRILSVAISSDGKCIVSGSDDTMVRVWDAQTGNALCAPLRGHSKQVWSVALSPDGRRIVSGSNDETIRVWDTYTGKALGDPLRGHFGPVTSVAISPDGKRIVSGSDDKTIRIWDMKTSKTVGLPLRGHTQSVQSVAVSPDGKYIVSSSGEITFRSYDGMILLWYAETGEALNTLLQGHTSCVRSVAISLEGKRIVAGLGDTIQMWDAETRTALGPPLRGHADHIHSVAISPDGKRIISGDHAFRIWDAETGEALSIPIRANSDDLLSVALSPNGRHIVSGSSDMTIRVWDPELLIPHQPLEAPAIRFSSNPTHALCCASSLLHGSPTPASLIRAEEGWVMGPEGRLLLWIPTEFHPVIYAPGNTLVIPNNALQLDLSCFAHGTLWHRCREQVANISSC